MRSLGFTLREILLLTCAVAMGCFWWTERQRVNAYVATENAAVSIAEQQAIALAKQSAMGLVNQRQLGGSFREKPYFPPVPMTEFLAEMKVPERIQKYPDSKYFGRTDFQTIAARFASAPIDQVEPAISKIIELLDSREAQTRQRAIIALTEIYRQHHSLLVGKRGALADKISVHLISTYHEGEHRAILLALAELGTTSKEVLQELHRLLADTQDADAPYAALVLYQMGDVDSARQGLLGLLKARHSEMIRPLFWHFLPYDETRLFILEQDAKLGSKTVSFDTVQMLNQVEFSKQLNEALRGDASLRCLEELYSFESIRTTYYRL